MSYDAGWGGGPGPYMGPPGWGSWGPPAAPKPGVIPLRPLGLGDVLGGAFATVGRCWKALFGIALTAYGTAIVVVGAALFLAYVSVEAHLQVLFDLRPEEQAASEDVIPVVIAFGSVWLIGILALLGASATIAATSPTVLREAVLGRPAHFGPSLRHTLSRLPAVIGTALLSGLIVMAPILLFAGLMIGLPVAAGGPNGGTVALLLLLCLLVTIPFAMWLWVLFSLAPAAVVFESAGPVKALRRSARLVRGAWWRIFGILLLIYVMASVAAYFIQMPFSLLGMFSMLPGMQSVGPEPDAGEIITAMSGYMVIMTLGSLIGQLVTAVFPALVTSLLYVDQRIRRESLDITLAEAAGVTLPPPPPAQPYYGP